MHFLPRDGLLLPRPRFARARRPGWYWSRPDVRRSPVLADLVGGV
jgi:hypothetical protein